MAVRQQPPWQQPANTQPSLKLYNSLTKSKVEFVPKQGRQVKWYICGPTVYDASHMGHARAYITFDIVRRVMEEYFSFDVFYQMNVTDVDDKIILRARQNFLFDQYKSRLGSTLKPDNWKELRIIWQDFVEKNIQKLGDAEITETAWTTLTNSSEVKQKLLDNPKFKMNFEAATSMITALLSVKDDLESVTEDKFEAVLETTRDIVAPWLDSLEGSTVSDHKIFRDLSSFWEADFLKDMDQLNVRRPDVMTRVSEYVPKIVTYIEKIIENGYGYESGGSVYFDAKGFDSKDHHHYAKLEPRSAFNAQLVEEGEGAISLGLSEKRAPWDFALWKASRPGEPVWESPWSKGRPGWHIECSVMASDVLGESIDIHSGGIDLAFPHHDNEMAQAEAYYGCSQWVNYFLHAGHLHIEGQKMSKSLKNFITIKDALKDYSARQIRILFLIHTWYSVLDFKKDSMNEARTIEANFKNFFLTVGAVSRENRGDLAVGVHNMNADEVQLLSFILGTQTRVHEAMCDSIDTPTVIDELLKLVSTVNVYINSRKQHNTALILKAAKYVQRILIIFGVIEKSEELGFGSGQRSADLEEAVTPFLETLATFRDNVRTLVREKKDPKEILALSDKLRDEDLPELGVRLEDREGTKTLIKLEDRATLIKERNEKKEREAERLRKKQEEKAKLEAKKLEKLQKGKTAPADFFKQGEYQDKFSAYDEQGIPTHEANGEEVAKKRRKKLEADYSAQVKLHEEYNAYLREAAATSSSSS